MSMVRDFVGLFFPNYCLSCSGALVHGEDTLCSRCIFNLPKTNDTFSENAILEKFTGRIQLQYGLVFLKMKKGGLVQKMLHQLKYHHHPEIGVKLGKVFGRELAERGLKQAFDIITPVPLHPTRLRKRGYNQSAKFAEGLSHALAVPWSESISVRKGRTKTQTRKSKIDRWENVKSAFSIAEGKLVEGKKVLLVDDVITTGATLEACGMHLISSGCSHLSIACIAEAQ